VDGPHITHMLCWRAVVAEPFGCLHHRVTPAARATATARPRKSVIVGVQVAERDVEPSERHALALLARQMEQFKGIRRLDAVG